MDVITHKCPNCGGPLTFEPSDQKFHCPYCLSIFTADELDEFERKQKEARMVDATDDNPAAKEDAAVGEMELYSCPNCGAQIVTDATTAATYCYYCHNPVVLEGRLSGKFLPDKVLPFTINKEDATKQFLAWSQKKWFVPKAFFNEDQVEKLTGVYFPYWNTNAEAEGGINGMGTSLRVWIIGDIEYTETKQYEVRRAGKLRFRNLVKNALSKNVQQKMVESVQPFHLDQAVSFKDQYLSGFQAEKRDIEYQELQDNIRNELEGYSESLLRGTVGNFSTFTINNSHLEMVAQQKEYLLLPVWLVTYRGDDDKKTTYYYAMNGQTGKVSGILPISYGKLALSAFGIFAVIAIILMIVGYLI